MSAPSLDLIEASPLPRHEAIRLLVSATGHHRSALIAGTEVTETQASSFKTLEARRIDGEPLQYIEGDVPFGGASIAVDERALIPRPETEEMFHLACGLADAPERIVDLCTGSGNLAVALATAFPDAQVWATELSTDAANLARTNVERNDVTATVLDGDLFAPLPSELRGRVDLLVSNPPYLAEAEMAGVPEDVRREPDSALVGGPLGTEIIERLAHEAPAWLAPNGVLVCEISEFDATRTVGLFGHMDAAVQTDMFGKDRFVVAHARVE
ncbi:MAG: peptide chain release factor N(5)-glutamine methyltransferase [Acidimicrobiia bacterium]